MQEDENKLLPCRFHQFTFGSHAFRPTVYCMLRIRTDSDTLYFFCFRIDGNVYFIPSLQRIFVEAEMGKTKQAVKIETGQSARLNFSGNGAIKFKDSKVSTCVVKSRVIEGVPSIFCKMPGYILFYHKNHARWRGETKDDVHNTIFDPTNVDDSAKRGS